MTEIYYKIRQRLLSENRGSKKLEDLAAIEHKTYKMIIP